MERGGDGGEKREKVLEPPYEEPFVILRLLGKLFGVASSGASSGELSLECEAGRLVWKELDRLAAGMDTSSDEKRRGTPLIANLESGRGSMQQRIWEGNGKGGERLGGRVERGAGR